jgi:hypothetical protein
MTLVIKPLCDALGLDSERAIKTLSDDEVLGAEAVSKVKRSLIYFVISIKFSNLAAKNKRHG